MPDPVAFRLRDQLNCLVIQNTDDLLPPTKGYWRMLPPLPESRFRAGDRIHVMPTSKNAASLQVVRLDQEIVLEVGLRIGKPKGWTHRGFCYLYGALSPEHLVFVMRRPQLQNPDRSSMRIEIINPFGDFCGHLPSIPANVVALEGPPPAEDYKHRQDDEGTGEEPIP